jgi:hypothetical protein
MILYRLPGAGILPALAAGGKTLTGRTLRREQNRRDLRLIVNVPEHSGLLPVLAGERPTREFGRQDC